MKLSPATLQVYDALVLYKQEHQGNSPSLRALARLAGRSLGATRARLVRLEALGLIVTHWPMPCAIELPGARWLPPPPFDKP